MRRFRLGVPVVAFLSSTCRNIRTHEVAFVPCSFRGKRPSGEVRLAGMLALVRQFLPSHSADGIEVCDGTWSVSTPGKFWPRVVFASVG